MTITLITTGIVITILSLVLLFEKRRVRVFDFISEVWKLECAYYYYNHRSHEMYTEQKFTKKLPSYTDMLYSFKCINLKTYFTQEEIEELTRHE